MLIPLAGRRHQRQRQGRGPGQGRERRIVYAEEVGSRMRRGGSSGTGIGPILKNGPNTRNTQYRNFLKHSGVQYRFQHVSPLPLVYYTGSFRPSINSQTMSNTEQTIGCLIGILCTSLLPPPSVSIHGPCLLPME